MIEEYENWEDSIRRTFIELADYMDKNANPLDTIIDFAWASGADRFWVNNAKDELKRLRKNKTKLDSIMNTEPVAYGKITQDGSLYDLRLQNNPYDNQEKVISLYSIKND